MQEDIREQVRQKYAKAIKSKTSCCGSSGCCDDSSPKASHAITGDLYQTMEMDGLPQNLLATSLGCGNPTALCTLYAGDIVLDLGSGAGLDVLLSARRVGPSGKAYGLDMTDEMLAEANANKAKAGAVNAEFLKGHIEEIPLPDETVDVVISNCVINLSADKERVFQEVYRVLKPGGRVAVSDIVTTKPLPEDVRKNLLAWVGCIAGALVDEDYKNKLTRAGFEDIELEVTRTYDFANSSLQTLANGLGNTDCSAWNGSVVSAFIRARKPSYPLELGKDFSIKLAMQEDFPAIQELLAKRGLPIAGVESTKGNYYIAGEQDVVGVIGVEHYGTAALLRSLAVPAKWSNRGIAQALVEHALQTLRKAGYSEVYVLTNTAEQYLQRYGFGIIERDKIPADILAMSALGCVCPTSSTCMYSKL